MSVLVKGMEMPKSCNECRFFIDAWCYALELDDWRNAYNKPPEGERLDGCPLIPVPPHGRLIDADALKEHMFVGAEDTYRLGWNDALEAVIQNAPTIIHGEEGE